MLVLVVGMRMMLVTHHVSSFKDVLTTDCSTDLPAKASFETYYTKKQPQPNSAEAAFLIS